MNSRLAAAAALLLAVAQAGVAWADTLDPPRYDSNLFCRTHAAHTAVDVGFSDEAQASCLSDQRMAYQAARRMWNELPDETQNSCTDATQVHDPQNYNALLGCLRNALLGCLRNMRRDFQSVAPPPLKSKPQNPRQDSPR